MAQVEAALNLGPIYNDGTYKYFGEASPGTPLTTAKWRVSRLVIATSQIEWANGNGEFTNVFTNVGIVAAFNYS